MEIPQYCFKWKAAALHHTSTRLIHPLRQSSQMVFAINIHTHIVGCWTVMRWKQVRRANGLQGFMVISNVYLLGTQHTIETVMYFT